MPGAKQVTLTQQFSELGHLLTSYQTFFFFFFFFRRYNFNL
jgi:hypothetical protein